MVVHPEFAHNYVVHSGSDFPPGVMMTWLMKNKVGNPWKKKMKLLIDYLTS